MTRLAACKKAARKSVFFEVAARAIGLMTMIDASKRNHKIVAVATGDPEFKDYHKADELPPQRLAVLRRFFQGYKQLEHKAVEVDEIAPAEKAYPIIEDHCTAMLAFIYADLIVLPILNIYCKYYGLRVSAFLFITMYASMAAAPLAIELLFKAVGLVPVARHARIVETAIQWNYTTILNIIFLALAATLLIRFFRTGSVKMLKMMDQTPAEHAMHHD